MTPLTARGALTTPPDPTAEPSVPSLHIERHGPDRLVVQLMGTWRLQQYSLRAAQQVSAALRDESGIRTVAFDAGELAAWDTALPAFLWSVQRSATRLGIALEADGLPEGARRLLSLASAVPPPDKAQPEQRRAGRLARLGTAAQEGWSRFIGLLRFLGEIVLACGALVAGRARYRATDFALVLQEVGPKALPIVTLISLLVGVILAFVGAVQLARFGAQIFIADLVGLAMAREMGPMMAAIIMTGRTGAAFAAQLGTMQVNQEIDALKTLGISPVEFLVLPRVLALVLMMPLLTLYADMVGIVGGMLVSVSLFEITLMQYWNETWAALTLSQFVIGLVKSLVFGALIAIAGCFQGIRAGGSASAVGAAATSAVVAAIVAIVVADGLFAVMLDALGL